VVWFHDGPWQRVPPGFQRDAQALAAMGFMVAQINYRGSTGFGRRQREAISEGFDRIPVDDALAAIEWLGARHGFDRKRVAVGGEGFGGYLALRAVQLHPDAFRCAVAINAPFDLAQLQGSEQETRNHRQQAEQAARAATAQGIARLEGTPITSTALDEMNSAGGDGGDGGAGAAATAADGETASLKAASDAAERAFGRFVDERPPPVDFARELARAFFGPAGRGAIAVTSQVERLTKPVFFLHDPRNALVPIAAVQELRTALERRKRSPAYLEISPQFAGGVAAARAPVFRKIGEFLNTNLYDFDVKIGEVKEKD
jgi:pimeloyl-ACP methyl ester carboxylesterase